MIKKTVTYNNPFDGTPTTEDHWFNLNKAEVTKMAMIEGEGIDDRIRAMVASKDTGAVLIQFEKLVAASYGKREDNVFVKSPEISQRFMSSEAYSELFLELITVPNAMQEFANGLMPKDLEQFVEKISAAQNATPSQPAVETTAEDTRPDWLKEGRAPSNDELKKATPEQIQQAFALRSQQA